MIILILLLLVPIYAPWLDVDFAAGQPFHGHIYLDQVKPNHHQTDQQQNEVINLPAQETLGNIVLLLLPLAEPAINRPPDDGNLALTAAEACLNLESAYLPLPKKPPRGEKFPVNHQLRQCNQPV